jgi:hypothetical protein
MVVSSLYEPAPRKRVRTIRTGTSAHPAQCLEKPSPYAPSWAQRFVEAGDLRGFIWAQAPVNEAATSSKTPLKPRAGDHRLHAFLLGLIPVATGLVGWCPPYALFGISTCPRKG